MSIFQYEPLAPLLFQADEGANFGFGFEAVRGDDLDSGVDVSFDWFALDYGERGFDS